MTPDFFERGLNTDGSGVCRRDKLHRETVELASVQLLGSPNPILRQKHARRQFFTAVQTLAIVRRLRPVRDWPANLN